MSTIRYFSDRADASALAARLDRAVEGGRFFHAGIVSGGSEPLREQVARALTAAAVCTAGHDRPCGRCSGCRKADADEHPDVVHIRSPKDKKTIPVETIRELKRTLVVRPNEAPRRVVLIHRAEELGAAGQNALLNMLEEPTGDVLFLLLTEREHSLLETVRSRCSALRLGATASEEVSAEGDEAAAEAVYAAFLRLRKARGSAEFAAARCALLESTTALSKKKSAELPDTLELLRGKLASELLTDEAGAGTLSAGTRRTLDSAERLTLRAMDYARANVSAGHLSGLLLAGLLELVKR